MSVIELTESSTGAGPRSTRWRRALVWLCGLIAGCASPGGNLVECPLSAAEQQQAVLEVVPRGTSRGEALRRLKEAGIEFTPGRKDSIYYLSLWNRANGERWHINVALLFDPAGNLYATRPADSPTEPLAEVAAEPVAASEPGNGWRAATPASAVSNRDDDLDNVPFPDQPAANGRSR
jgi:hypothetical protein